MILDGAAHLVACIVFLALLLVLSPLYTFTLALLAILAAVVTKLATRRVRSIGDEAVSANESFTAYVWDVLFEAGSELGLVPIGWQTLGRL
jgi:phage-related minor tail protein